MPVNTSPRQRDSLDYEEDPSATDPRFIFGFRSLTLESSGYEQHEPQDDHRPFAGTPDPATNRRKRQQRRGDSALKSAVPFQYLSVADGDAFRLVVLLAGAGSAPIECRVIWASSKDPRKDYRCLSYCWGTDVRDAAILCDGYRFRVTQNLLRALQSLRRPKTNLLIWIDQICINQEDHVERSHQVSIMKHIFTHARKVVVWLGEEDDRSKKLCEYAEKVRIIGRGEDSPKGPLNRLMNQRQLQDAMQKLLQRPWFQRVWVIPEVALGRLTDVVCGQSTISWDNLVRLVRDTQPPQAQGFNKQTALLGNPRQRIAIITQMIASQRRGLLHTDITQLLILAKSSQATEVRDKVYAFYGVTLLSTHPDYTRSIGRLYIDIAQYYINSLLWDDYYSRWHGLSERQRTQQLMSILYSAGKLHQHLHLPSWAPDWTYAWYQAPIWCKTDSNVVTGTGRDEWSDGIRSDYRAGGERLGTFDIHENGESFRQLRISAWLFDTIIDVSETAPAPTSIVDAISPASPSASTVSLDSPTFSYGRDFFRTATGLVGMATRGIANGDLLASLLGGDVPVVLRRAPAQGRKREVYELLCECFVQSADVMDGDMIRNDETLAKDIVLI